MKKVLVPIEAVRDSLGDDAAKRLLEIVDPVPQPIADGARRFVRGVPGDRVRRLKDRAAFAAIMVRLVEQDEDLRRRIVAYIDRLQTGRRASRPRRSPKMGRAPRK